MSPAASRSDKEAVLTCSRANADSGIFSVVEDANSATCSMAKVLECVPPSVVKEVECLSRSVVKELDSASRSEVEEGGCPDGPICGKYIRLSHIVSIFVMRRILLLICLESP